MLKMLDKSEVPNYRNTEKSEVRRFAAETLQEFMEASTVGDIAEVADAPEVVGHDESAKAEKVVSAIRTEIFYLSYRDHIKAFRRKDRIFLERKEPWDQKLLRIKQPTNIYRVNPSLEVKERMGA